MRNPQRQRALFATSGRFRRPNQPETPYSAVVSPGRRSRQRTTSAENHTEAQDPRQNQRPFPAKPSRTRGGAHAGEAAAAVSADAGATRGIAANTPPSPVRRAFTATALISFSSANNRRRPEPLAQVNNESDAPKIAPAPSKDLSPCPYTLGPIVFVDPPHRVEAVGHGQANRYARPANAW